MEGNAVTTVEAFWSTKCVQILNASLRIAQRTGGWSSGPNKNRNLKLEDGSERKSVSKLKPDQLLSDFIDLAEWFILAHKYRRKKKYYKTLHSMPSTNRSLEAVG